LLSANIIINQTSLNSSGLPNLFIASGGSLDLYEITDLANTSFVQLNEYSSITFKHDASANADNNSIPIFNLFVEGSIIDDTNIGTAINGLIQFENNYDAGNYIFSSPIQGLNTNDFTASEFYNWSESQNKWDLLSPSTDLQVMNAYKINYSTPYFESFIGNANQGISSINLSNSDLANPNQSGWNLIGNPFTSAIDWELVTLSGVENTLYKFNAETKNYSYYQQGGFSLNNGNQLVLLSDGFFVKVNPQLASTTFNFNEGKVHNIPGLLSLVETNEKSTTETILFTLNGDNAEQTMVGLNQGSNLNFESNKDIFKLFAQVPQIYTLSSNSEYLAANIFDIQPEDYIIIPMNFKCTVSGLYSLSMTNLINRPNLKIYLHDILTDEKIDLSLTNFYEFTFNSLENEQRFEIIFDYRTTKIENIENQNDIIIYSYANEIYVKTFADETYNMEIYNTIGVKIDEIKINGAGFFKFQVNNTSGIYSVKISNKNYLKTKKILIIN